MKTELYTAFQLSAIRITAAVMLLSAVIGSVLHWVCLLYTSDAADE